MDTMPTKLLYGTPMGNTISYIKIYIFCLSAFMLVLLSTTTPNKKYFKTSFHANLLGTFTEVKV